MNMNAENQKHVDSIAAELIALYNGELIADEYEAEKLGIEEGEPLSVWDYFTGDDIYNIDYIVGSDCETLRGVRLMVACGGPNIYINTWENKIQLYWWTDYAEAGLPHEVSDAITEVFQEYFSC